MQSTWLDSDWKKRLKRQLEPLLKASDLEKQISTYRGVPFGLFVYPPTAERELRREVELLSTRIESETTRRVTTISMSDLLWGAIKSAYPPDGEALFDAERSMAEDDPRRRLEDLQETVRAVVSDICPIPKLVEERVAELDPEKAVVFLVRLGALYPAYRASALLENLMGKVRVPTILFYPGTRAGTNSLRFMDSLEALHGYRHKIF